MTQSPAGFDSLKIGLATTDKIKLWSYGEVTKPETINYRTLRPEKDGLFCEKIFGPTKDWECYCGKYKKIRYRGVICDRCGVEVARSKVRRERMGTITLAAPVAHIWFAKGSPSRLGMILNLSPRNLERILYFAQYLVTRINVEAKDTLMSKLEEELTDLDKSVISDDNVKNKNDKKDSTELNKDESLEDDESQEVQLTKEEIKAKTDEINMIISDLKTLNLGILLTDQKYKGLRNSSIRHGLDVFSAEMGAEAVTKVLKTINLDTLRDELQKEIRETTGQRLKKAVKRLRVVEAFRKSGNALESMILEVIPVLPPELRPMVQLDGGRFAASDLNDLYRRVINRNNRLKRLLELSAPEIIVRNEKRMLQESVDALIDNGRRGRPVLGSHNHTLKSLSDLLRGKQGRFRQNLLGKRVDYSARSVIIVGPELKLNQCGIPRKMAIELFKPFVMHKLVILGYAHNIRTAKRLVDKGSPEVWEILEEVVKERPVLLNRAPTLHRLGIQAFEPVLINGSAVRVHPLVCAAFNADFDGDQMAVHLPLSKTAIIESRRLMLSSNNMLTPSSGEPIVAPTLDIVLGCYYLTGLESEESGNSKLYSSFDEALLAYNLKLVKLRDNIRVRNDKSSDKEVISTTIGRIIFNSLLHESFEFYNQTIDKGLLKDITLRSFKELGNEETSRLLDAIKSAGFEYATKSGITMAINDIKIPNSKYDIVKKADNQIETLENKFNQGFITEDEKYRSAVNIWTEANEQVTAEIEDSLSIYGGLYFMASSGAKGNIAQIKQMAGMRGLMSDPKGKIIDRPIKSNFREGLTVLEYFISTHGARKGLADTALRTADSGYLTRRLIDVAQEMTIVEDDCGTEDFRLIEKSKPEDQFKRTILSRIKGRYIAKPIVDSESGEILVEKNTFIDDAVLSTLSEDKIESASVFTPLSCSTERGLCIKCYGGSLANWDPVMIGEAVGIIAAQSIGEPGTQLTMRTFHTGGIASVADITSGLPRVEELFEARTPKGQAILSDIDGVVDLLETSDGLVVQVSDKETMQQEIQIPKGWEVKVKDGDSVIVGTELVSPKGQSLTPKEMKNNPNKILESSSVYAQVSGDLKVTKQKIVINWENEETREYLIPAASNLIVERGDFVEAGSPLTAGPKSPQQILAIQDINHVQKYLIEEVQNVYLSQGVSINDKHIEVIVSQMLRKVRIDTQGDTDYIPGELIVINEFENKNDEIMAEGGEPATATPVLLGITRASLNMDSFLAAASFQETTRVLTEAATNGQVDDLKGLKENVIIGRLIPARFDETEEGRKKLGLDELIDDVDLNLIDTADEMPNTDVEESDKSE
tara:strand:- start:2463 stop:6455 length:3993 start_codon:yes stop_codon:yes gene_type:complete